MALTTIPDQELTPLVAVPPAEAMLRRVQSMQAELSGLTDDAGLDAAAPFWFGGLSRPVIALPDVTVDTTRRLRVIELNVGNGAGTCSDAADLPRVAHETATILAAGMPEPDAVFLRAWAPNTRSTPEIQARSALLAAFLSHNLGCAVGMVGTGRTALPAGRVVVCGSVPELADGLECGAGGFTYLGRPVRFIGNPNLLVEFARRTGQPLAAVLAIADDVLPEGADLALLGTDKVRQQWIAGRCDGFTPIASRRVTDTDAEAIADAALHMADTYGAVMVRPDSASGGAGVFPVQAGADRDDVVATVRGAQRDMAAKYGPGYERTCPWAVYEFVDALPAQTPDGPRRWDLRLLVLATPEATRITPLSARLCPDVISGKLDRESTVVNQTGRAKGAALGITPGELCRLTGLDEGVLHAAACAAYEYLTAATFACPDIPS